MKIYVFKGKVKDLLVDLRKFIERRENECKRARV